MALVQLGVWLEEDDDVSTARKDAPRTAALEHIWWYMLDLSIWVLGLESLMRGFHLPPPADALQSEPESCI